MVGGLVEQQQIGWTHQGLCQVQAHPPTAGEVADASVHLLGGEAQTSQQLARAGIGGVTVGAVELTVQTRYGSAIVGCLGDSQVSLDLAQAYVAVEHIVHRQAIEGVDLLAHVGDAPIARQLAVACIGR